LGWAQGLSASDPRQSDLRKKIEKYEDAGYGACRLQNDRVANIVESAILHFDAERYRIIAWCVMPNHVHIIIEILEKFVLSKVIHSWKSYTAHTVNEILHRSGEFWFREYHDRYIRDPEHLARAVEYVENNPVKAKLAAKKEDWKWSSASLKENQYF
jgi:REP element-mobilizing transposase RayT